MIEARDVTVAFSHGRLRRKKILALRNFSLHVERGDIFGLLGPNGAGKSTAMYTFLGLIRPNYGAITLMGEKPIPGSPIYERIAYLPEEPHYHLYLTVREAIAYYASLYTGSITMNRVDEAIEEIGLGEFKNLKLSKCSKGMKQKMGIAVSLIKEVELLFLDEPTRGLDPLAVQEFRNALVALNRRGTTILLNSHILSEVEIICTRAAVMKSGTVLVQDSMENLLSFDREHYVVAIDHPEEIPPFILKKESDQKILKGIVHREDLSHFFTWIRDRGLTLYSCSLKQLALEEAFINILKDDNRHDA